MTQKIGRNDPCPCGSGKKYKHCCMRKDRQRRRAGASSSTVRLGESRTSPIQEQLAQIRSMGQAIMDQVPSDQAQELQQLLEQAEELAAYEALRDEIEAATQVLEAHRAEFEALMKDGIAAVDHAHRLFSEEPFAAMRYTAADVHRAFEAVGYPSRYREEPTEEDMEMLVAAVLHLADEDQRLHLARQLLMLLPEYVSSERYLDAWLIQHSAFRMIEAPNESNPFLFTMFNLAFAEWASQVDSQQEALMHELGIDRSAVTGMSVDEVEAWLQEQMADPAKRAQIEDYYAAHPMMSDQTEAELIELERGTLSLLERDDADPLYLLPEELEPWVPVLLERLAPIKEQARQAAERGDWKDPGTLQAMGDIFVEIAREMVPVIFTPERLDQLVADLRDYRRKLLDKRESQAAMHAHAAFMMLEREETPAENPLLIGICFASLRLLLITLSEEAQAEAEDRAETEEVES
jgi:hypothetical protein